MIRSTHPRAPWLALLLILSLAGAAGLGACGGTQTARASGAAAVSGRAAAPSGAAVRVSSATVGAPVRTGFLGLSMEYKALLAYAGQNPAALDGPFVQLLRNLAPAGGTVLRIGGDSTDWTWWPMPHHAAPGGARYAVGPGWTSVARSIATATQSRLILGIQFEADSRSVAAYEAAQLIRHVGRPLIDALELGNEPELYAAFPWYKTRAGQHVYGRSRSCSPQALITDWGRVAAGLPRGVQIAGPGSGSPRYLDTLGAFEAREPRLGLVTVHAYPLKHCSAHTVLTPGQFFTFPSLQGLANMVHGWVTTAARRRLPVRVDEMNAISCGGQKGLSQAFAPALWALDMLPRIARAGAAGVNFHTVPGTNQALLSATHSPGGWRVAVEPEYYGLLAFAQAAPAGASFLRVSTTRLAGVDTWAARAPGGAVHVVLINPGRATRTTVAVGGGTGAATVTHLAARGLLATGGVTLGGQHVNPASGALSGSPEAVTVQPSGGAYPVRLPAHSATILSVSG